MATAGSTAFSAGDQLSRSPLRLRVQLLQVVAHPFVSKFLLLSIF